MENASPSRWSKLELSHLFNAYRKAKSDCFFERTVGAAHKFVEYEQNLPENLASLLKTLKREQIDVVLSANLGVPRLSAKRLGLQEKKSGASAHSFFSDPSRAFESLLRSHSLEPEFRLIGDFPVDMHILSALWINLVGHKFDASLSQHCYGSRLRRYRASKKSSETVGSYHLHAIGSFEPYFRRYRSWREDGLNAIRNELKLDRSVVVMSMDFTCYYHQIDPAFLADDRFLKTAKIELTAWEKQFTTSFAVALSAWADLAVKTLREAGCGLDRRQHGGIPIGLTISKVISNVLLLELDSDIVEGLAPIYYGRYVDDIFLVLRDPGNVNSAHELMEFIAKRTRSFPEHNADQALHLKLPGGYQRQTSLVLQPKKQKVFFLNGPGGLDLLDNIETQIRSVSSERRLMPSPDRLEDMASAKVLTSAGNAADEPDALRKADGLSVRRLGWAVQLRAVETLARDLQPKEWREERARFYQFAKSHILRPDRLLEHLDYLPRLVSLAVAVGDWSDANGLVDEALSALSNLEEKSDADGICINGIKSSRETRRAISFNVWEELKLTMRILLQDATLRAIPWNSKTGEVESQPKAATRLFEKIGLQDSVDVPALALQFREADWASISLKDHLRHHARREPPRLSEEELLYDCYEPIADVVEFLARTSKRNFKSSAGRLGVRVRRRSAGRSLIPYLFPNRAYTASEIALFLPQLCIFSETISGAERSTDNWGRFVHAMRGIWISPPIFQESEDDTSLSVDEDESGGAPPKKFAVIGTRGSTQSVRLGISSLATTDDSWMATASGNSDISRNRYKRIERIVNLAVQTQPKPDYLLLPELSLPTRWLRTVTRLLQNANISLICGLDYHHPGANRIHSEAAVMLLDRRLGFRSFIEFRQPKQAPAPSEEHDLESRFGKSWSPNLQDKPIYIHNGFCFGVLICSELQNVGHRLKFQGKVDSLMVLSWNKDVETFSSLIESASLDVHAFIALVNNRRFGDSRVRVPAKKSFDRDRCRLRGGLNDHLVVVDVEIESLRKFQSRSKRWPYPDDDFKPVPEGFKISGIRRSIP
jgi:hypothetical protein